MAEVWKRPLLTGMEVLWRWLFWIPAAAACGRSLGINTGNWQEYLATLERGILGRLFEIERNSLGQGTAGILLLVLLWALSLASGRSLILQRLDGRLRVRWAKLALFAMFGAFALLAFLGLWFFGVMQMSGLRLLTPLADGIDPTYVPRFAGVVGLTLVLFMLWSLVSWVLQIAPVLAMSKNLGVTDSLRAAFHIGALRSKLIEINFVMGIVKVALLVLAMVFSASPMPFSSVETQSFLNWWWFGCFLFWVVASDYFHVVRAAAYLRLWQAYEPQAAPALSPDGKAAS